MLYVTMRDEVLLRQTLQPLTILWHRQILAPVHVTPSAFSTDISPSEAEYCASCRHESSCGHESVQMLSAQQIAHTQVVHFLFFFFAFFGRRTLPTSKSWSSQVSLSMTGTCSQIVLECPPLPSLSLSQA